MNIIISGRKIEVTDPLKEKVRKKLGKLDKFFNEGTYANVTLEVEKGRHRVEVTIPFNGIILRAEEENHDMYVAIDRITDIIERQIRKNRTRLEKRLRGKAFKNELNKEKPTEAGYVEEEKYFNVVKTKRFAIKPMDTEEAILQMNLLGHQFFVFSNTQTDEVNVVYKRKDGDYGLIEPEF
jgi:putative sigma-54 modulation protein